MEFTLIGFLVCLVLIIMGVPIAMAFGILTIMLLSFFGQDAAYLVEVTYKKVDSVILFAVPLFILFGTMLDATGLAKRLIDFINLILGRFRSGLGAVTVVTTALFSSISGTDSAAIACIGTVMIPRLVEKGYTRGHATALVACSGILGQLVPPSVPMIFYAIITGNSILGVWFSTLGPAIVIVIIYCLINAVAVRKMPIVFEKRAENLKEQIVNIALAGKSCLPVLILPIFIFGSLYSGLITPTEVALIGVFYVLILGLLYRVLSWEDIKGAAVSTAVISGAVTLMFYFTETTSKILILEGVTDELASWVVNNSPNQVVTLLLLNVILLLLGMMMNDLSGTVISAGLLWPIASAAGVDPYHFAAITGVNLGLGTVTPPTAPMLFLAGRIGKCSAEEYIKPALILMWSGMLPVLLLTTYFPNLCLFIPRALGFIK
ncbi:MAG: TRAP transporter large permease [Desulfamplus sp.]|nr:TRAP transporter large permease [Desulfamplus sp.]MBF0389720.1 TRAP transporter large permease [Desulfamplus sp.]